MQMISILFSLWFTLQLNYPAFTLVESYPIETHLDTPDIPETASVWLEMFRSARRSIDIEQFYISSEKGEALEPIITELINAGSRGVRIRIIIDKRMALTYPEPVKTLAASLNIEVRIIDFVSAFGGVQHSKFFIVDNQEAFMGSQNFDWRALTHITEIGLRIREKRAVDFYTSVFEMDWGLAGGKDISTLRKEYSKKIGELPFVSLQGPSDTVRYIPTASPLAFIPDPEAWDEFHMMSVIEKAINELRLQFLSYSARDKEGNYYAAIDSSLRAAASRGVKVRLMVADWGKGRRSEKDLKELSALPNIEVRYSVIPEWSGGYIPFARVEHCKIIIADDHTFWLGTSNMEKGYFDSSRNLGIVIMNKGLTTRLANKFNRSWNNPTAETIRAETVYMPREYRER